jgi:hypothetical protein
MSMKNSIDAIRNQTRDLSTYSAVPQPTAPHLNYDKLRMLKPSLVTLTATIFNESGLRDF